MLFFYIVINNRKGASAMSFIGKLHEISFYGLLANILCLLTGRTSVGLLWNTVFHVRDFPTLFQSYLFWASVLFIPIATIGAFATKYSDGGEGLTFGSNNIVVIMFAHIGEELLGLLLTVCWFLKDLFTKNFNGWKVFDYVTYVIELVFILIGILII